MALLVCHQCLFRSHPTAQTRSLGGPSGPLGPNEPTSLLISLTPRPHHRFLPPPGSDLRVSALRLRFAQSPPRRRLQRPSTPTPTAPRDAGPRRRLPREGPGLVLRPPGAVGGGDGALPPPTLRDLWRGITTKGRTAPEKAESVVDFVADKMNRAWIGFGSAPEGSMKSRIHSFGLKLLSRVRPSEVLLKSVTKDVRTLEIVHPASINSRLVRRRLRHIAIRGASVHKKFLYGSVCLLPVTSFFMVLPLPNIPFFWVLFRAYSHWRALQGSERLQLLLSDCSDQWKVLEKEIGSGKDGNPSENARYPWKLQPSKRLDGFLEKRNLDEGLDCDTISRICKEYDLDKIDVLKYRDLP